MEPKLLVFLVAVILCFSSTCTATTYMVGDNSGWDISTDLDSWTSGKQFQVGDVLAFQYSSTHSVSKVKKDSYDGCNTSNVLESSSNGNTSFTLTQPGDSYFLCGNRLHCLGGMKLHVVTQGDSPAASPAMAPQTGGGEQGGGSSLPRPSSKSNKPSSSAATFYHVTMLESVSIALFGFVVSTWIL
ncbi:Phytocyanin domain-containing protein [Heracleum sosnowskyi]|uniref:Phytocyanin domain-containing protein n=1 Tax=Heracleum sosnowskyi TaxID=360622 RepID=A0AAD8HHW3_9APIA|nr:Phytocyanin domain-containing protein [Heracleum sosnowskyi]